MGYSAEQSKIFLDDFIENQTNMIVDLRYSDANGMNNAGVEKLFFDTLNKMGLNGKVSLQRVTEENGNITVTNMEKKGSTITKTECSNT